jgi:hypothetical protein
MSQSRDEGRSLYRFEYYEPEDEFIYVDWVWLNIDEVNDYKSGLTEVKFRPATKDESELYDEAYADGYGVAALMEFESQYDGVTFRVALNENGDLDLDGKKMFQCALCDRHLDFDSEIATARGMYLGAIKDNKLWHVCHDCAQGDAEVGLEQGWIWDEEK